MLRSGDSIRLTSNEREVFASITGGEGLPAPTTVAEHNKALQDASEYHAQRDTAEDKLLAALALDLLA
ncbi:MULTISPECIES: hypothetical protein [unclassified Variovorax]|uniref:hypothetical protein n=1 Tax=unclassified Variovorax TaxID=663243 RepID=UPI0013197BAE|nr:MULTISPECIES: hypothetical protein [unclassified Variovorax]VTU42916.1 hypothetical protein H6P1_00311 [Variovorax sp. PBL-H6]VTU43588.1 hypothetical protein SRS16P1_00594 [Variovorax sp. SRS16]VTU43650.1 hypothetical protein E5P1_00588 [Variovorax sp. PBL-E5]